MSTSVEIQYCVPCGHLPRAIDLQRTLLDQFGQQLDGVRLKTGAGGVFTIDVDGERIYDKKASGEALDVDAVVARIAERVAATTPKSLLA